MNVFKYKEAPAFGREIDMPERVLYFLLFVYINYLRRTLKVTCSGYIGDVLCTLEMFLLSYGHNERINAHYSRSILHHPIVIKV